MTGHVQPIGAEGGGEVGFYLGLDLGQAADPSALVGLERRFRPEHRPTPGPRRLVPHYTVRGLRRWPLGTLYTAIVDDVVGMVGKPPLSGCTLGVDYTGCGRPFVDMLRKANPSARVRPVLITAGFAVQQDGATFHVPKRELVAVVQLILQSRRLSVPATIAERKTVEQELLAFRAKVSAKGNEQFEADWRQRAHDDIVLGLAIAAWLGERTGRAEGNCRPTVYTGPGTNRFQHPRGGRYVAGGVEPEIQESLLSRKEASDGR